MDFITSKKHDSKAFPGVSFSVRTLTEGVRIKLSLALASHYAMIADLRAQADQMIRRVKPVIEQAERDKDFVGANAHPEVQAAARLQGQIASIERDRIQPEYVQHMIEAVEGATIAGQPITPENILQAPPELFEEMIAACKRELGLEPQEQGNSASPSTSPALEGGMTNSTIAGAASSVGNTDIATAPASSPIE